MIGKTISHYRILEKLGEGGMGVVYKAEDTKLDRVVALKFLPPSTGDDKARHRFVHEARAVSALEHPNICVIHEIDETPEGQMFIVMPCYEGESLAAKIARGPLQVDQAVEIALQVASGLARAHEKGLVHRDIKPGNVLITKDGAKIVDFGLAKLAAQTRLTRTGTTVGTVMYMSPEQARGGEIDHRSDIWSVGVVLYEMLTGRLPFAGEHEAAVLYQIMNDEPEPVTGIRADVPEELARIVARALRKDPRDRYERTDDLVNDLKSVKKGIETGRWQPLSRGSRRKHRVLSYVGVAVLGAVAVVAVLRYAPRHGGPMDSVAILPFTNVYANPDVDYLSEGMAESIIKSLSGVPSLKKIIAYSSVLRYKQKDIDPRAVGKELGVGALLLGRVSQRGDELTISVELVNAAENTRIWGDQYTESFSKIFDVRDRISEAIADNLKLKLTPSELSRMTKRYTANANAYQDYLKGNYFVNRRSQADLEKSYDYFKNAIAQDSTFALAYAGLGDYYMTMGEFNLIPKAEAYANGKTNFMKALELDPTESRAYTLLADFKEYSDWDWVGAEEALRRAIQLNPFDAYAHHSYSHMLTTEKRFDEATAEMKRALELEPLAVYTNACFGQNLYLAGRYDDAIQQLRKTIDLDSTHYDAHGWLGMAYFQEGRREKGIRVMEEASKFEVIRVRMGAALAYAYAVEGRRKEARQKLDEVLKPTETKYFDPYFVAWAYVGVGDNDSAFVWLEKAYDERSAFLREWLTVDPWLATLHTDERFAALVKRLGL
jgi:TolB-like protein/Tfp pilus assembly protein PilF